MANSHYIPQLILRHFCANNSITYCDIQKRKVETRNTRSVFTEKGYYPDELEKSLCEKIEVQFADLLNKKILNSRIELILTADELLTLKKFLLITIYRYKIIEPNELELYNYFSKEEIEDFKGDFFENLNKILECRTKEEMFQYTDFKNESSNLTLNAYIRDVLYSYIIFVSSKRCEEDFVIPDKGYASYEGSATIKKLNAILELAKKTNDPLLFHVASMSTPHEYSVFPLTSNVAVLTMSPFYKLCLKNSPYNIKYPTETPTLSKTLGFGNREIIEAPKLKAKSENENEYTYEIKQLKVEDMTFLNSLLLTNVDHCFAYADISRIQETVNRVNENMDLSFLKCIDK